VSLSLKKQQAIRHAFHSHQREEEDMEDDGYYPDEDEERRNEAIFECAVRLRLREETVERVWVKLEETEL
jgi:hypothetical protein